MYNYSSLSFMDSHSPFLRVMKIVIQVLVGQKRKESHFAAITALNVQRGKFQTRRVSNVEHRAHQ